MMLSYTTAGVCAWMARHTRSGFSGKSRCPMPSGSSASRTALAIAGVALHLDDADVRAEREREVLGLVEARCLEAGLEAGRQVLGDVGFAGELAPRNRPLRDAGRPERARREDDVIGVGAEEVCRQR